MAESTQLPSFFTSCLFCFQKVSKCVAVNLHCFIMYDIFLGENFFVRSIQAYAKHSSITSDKVLCANVKLFANQEVFTKVTVSDEK